MKQRLLLITLFFTFFLSHISILYAQKTKSFTVYKLPNNKFNLNGLIKYDVNNVVTDTSYWISVMDEQYTMIYESIILKSGTIQECYDFLKEVKSAVDNEDIKTTLTIGGCRVYVCKIFGVRSGMIHSPEEYSKGYCCYDYGQLYGIINHVKSSCLKRNIKLNP